MSQRRRNAQGEPPHEELFVLMKGRTGRYEGSYKILHILI
jgi:hypothetical protein